MLNVGLFQVILYDRFVLGGIRKKIGRGLGSESSVRKHCDIAEHATPLMIEAEELVDARSIDYAEIPGGPEITWRRR